MNGDDCRVTVVVGRHQTDRLSHSSIENQLTFKLNSDQHCNTKIEVAALETA